MDKEALMQQVIEDRLMSSRDRDRWIEERGLSRRRSPVECGNMNTYDV